MEGKQANKRVFATLVDTLLCLLLSTLVQLITRSPFIAGLSNSALFLLRDTIFPGGSPGKRLARLELSMTGNGFASRARASLLRNLPLQITALASTLLGSALAAFSGLIIFAGLVVYLVEYFKMRRSGIRYGDRFAGTRVKDLRPEESQGKYFLYSLLVLFLYMGMVHLYGTLGLISGPSGNP